MKSLIAILTVCYIAVGCAEPGVRDSNLRILDKNILGATYVVCGSAVKWDGVAFTIDGLKGELSSKTYTLGKINFQTSQVRELNTIALSVDAMFRQMCQSTIALGNQPQALALYIKDRDKTALKLFELLASMESTNLNGSDAAEIVQKQKQEFKEVTDGDK